MNTAPILVGDIGGTHSRLALAERREDGIHLFDRCTCLNSEAADPATLLDRFLAGRARPVRLCLAVAGPVEGMRARLTNLDWYIDATALAAALGIHKARLINDFEAVARGLDGIPAGQLVTLQAGRPQPRAPRVALGPGTGLGVALSVWAGDGYRPLAGEGGHLGFAPADAEQADLLRFLAERHGRVSVERILSGPGIAALYAYTRSAAGQPAAHGRNPAEISAAALGQTDPAAVAALRLFARILGQTAGDLALVAGAAGGVFLAGGIPAKVLPCLQDGACLAGFRAKGRFAAWMEGIPLHVVGDPDIALRGAALAALAD
jgi:glucokinase